MKTVIRYPVWDELNENYERKCICFRKTFDADENTKNASIKVYGGAKYLLYVNTLPVLRFISFSDRDNRKYKEADISQFIRNGKNAICVMMMPEKNEIPFLYIEASVEKGNKEIINIKTDSSFKCDILKAYVDNAPKMDSKKPCCEIFDNRVYDESWLEGDFDDTKWINAQEIDDKYTLRLEKDSIDLKEEEITAKIITAAGAGNEAEDNMPLNKKLEKEVSETDLGHVFVVGANCEIKPLDKGNFSYVLLDFEKAITGFLRLDITAYNGDIVDVCFAKELKDERPLVDSVARFILKDDKNIVETRFQKNTFRYVLLIFRNYVRTNVVNKVTAISYFADFEKETQEIIKLNVTDRIEAHKRLLSYEEKLLYVKVLYEKHKDTRYFKELIKNIGYHQLSDSRFVKDYPYDDTYADDTEIMLFAPMVLNYYEYTKDISLLKEMYNRCLAVLNYFIEKENKEGIIEENDIKSLTKNLYYFNMIDSLKKEAEILEEREISFVFEKKAKTLKNRIRKTFYNDKIKAYSEVVKEGQKVNQICMDANVLALHILHDKNDKNTKVIVNNITDYEDHTIEKDKLSSYMLKAFYNIMKKTGDINKATYELERDGSDIAILCKMLIEEEEK